jgi:hypothetical protein
VQPVLHDEDPLAERERDDQHRRIDASTSPLLAPEAAHEQDEADCQERISG